MRVEADDRNHGVVVRDSGARITGVDIPFGDLVMLFVKCFFASIIATVIVGILVAAPVFILASATGVSWK